MRCRFRTERNRQAARSPEPGTCLAPIVSSISSKDGLAPGLTARGFFLPARTVPRQDCRPGCLGPSLGRRPMMWAPARCPAPVGLSSCTCHDPAPHPRRLPQENPDCPRVRRGGGVGAGARQEPQPPPAQQGTPEARRPAARVQLQVAGRLQQDGAPHARAAAARRDLRLGRQPRPGRGHERPPTGHARRDRDAHHHAAAQD